MKETGEERQKLRIKLYGIVQGVGFRPFVSRLAKARKVGGSVANRGSYVEILAVSARENMKVFLADLAKLAPPRSRIVKITTELWETDDCGDDFRIAESAKEDGAVFVSPDIAVCENCRRELFDPANRRYLHPFINCTDCGPRLTIIEAMPYDRPRTSMGDFVMCETCAEEYRTPADRRYDAQPVCCHDCGPKVYVLNGEESGADAITAARRVLAAGGIVALKGIGGFHLCCDATDETAVARLRELKHREQKPFALMFKNLKAVAESCIFDDRQKEILIGPEKPILLLPQREHSRIAPNVAPHSPKLGVMLPYTPLHLLLFDYPDGFEVSDALVMTSGNPSGVPICHTDEEAEELLPLCDLILSHDRRIRLRADDTVMDWLDDRPYMIRRSRGYAPLPLMTEANLQGRILAVGGELKNTFCLTRGGLIYPSPYIGDMSDLRTVESLKDSVALMSRLLEINPEFVACDLHPAYHTTQFAQSFGVPLIKIQHHYAHILSCMAENESHAKVIGVAFDGTGYGTDGTVWGGEIFLADAFGFERLFSVQPFRQAGGEKAPREGWRIALALMEEDAAHRRKMAADLALCTEKEFSMQNLLLEKNLNAVTSTSAGRIFDAVSAILGIKTRSAYEAEAAIMLEYAAMKVEAVAENFPAGTGLIDGKFLATTRLFNWLISRRLRGDNAQQLAYDFHAALAQMISFACVQARRQTKVNTVALSGGVFQNILLTRLTKTYLTSAGFCVLTHSLIPPNDGGICVGQALAALYALNVKKT